VAGQPGGRPIQRLLAPHRHFLGQCLGDELDLLVGIRAATATAFARLYRHKPVHVGVLQ